MKQEDAGATIAIVVIKGVLWLLVFGLLFAGVAAYWLLPASGRVLRGFTIAGRVPVASLLRRMTGGWPAEEAINAPPTAFVLALILWSVLGMLLGVVLILLGAPLLCLLIGFSAGLLTGALCGLMKEPQPQRPQTLEDVYPADWHL
jgi:hypothetical protein